MFSKTKNMWKKALYPRDEREEEPELDWHQDGGKSARSFGKHASSRKKLISSEDKKSAVELKKLAGTMTIPTDPFPTLELKHPSHDVSELYEMSWSPNCEALKLWKSQSGWEQTECRC